MTAPVTVLVELDTDGVWTDITSYVSLPSAIQITRGRADEQAARSPTKCTLNVNNRDGRFSPRNPTGPYYGKFGRNSLIRVTANATGTPSVRFTGEVPAWAPRWEYSESDVWVPIQAAGVRRRLGQGSVLRGALERASLATSGLGGYWPMDDPDGSTSFASLVSGVDPLTPTGTIDYAGNTTAFPLQPALPLFTSGSASGLLPSMAAGRVQAGILAYVPSGLGGLTHSLINVQFSGGGVGYAELGLLANTGQLSLSLYDASGSFIVGASTGVVDDIRNRPVRLQIDVHQNGTAVDMKLGVLYGGIVTTYTDSIAATTLGTPVRVSIGDPGLIAGRSPLVNIAAGQLLVADVGYNPADYIQPVALWAGEFADARIQRLCAEEGVSIVAGGPTTGGGGVTLGPQQPGTLLALLDEAADADLGVLAESRGGGMFYTVGIDLYNQDASATIPYTKTNEFTPQDDDQFTRNDVTVTRIGGASARYELTAGALSVQDPPDGVGRYDEGISLSLYTDDQVGDQASFRVRLGTVDETRYPAVGFDLVNSGFSTGVKNAILALDEGDRFDVSDPPTFAGAPEDLRQLVSGWSETITAHRWQITLVGVPAAGYDVGVYDDTGAALALEPGSRYSSDGTVTAEALDTTETAIDISTPSGPVWSTVGADYPFDINIGGEQITVGGCTGSGASQTFTSCTRSVNGVVKSHLIGAAVTLWQPARYALWRD